MVVTILNSTWNAFYILVLLLNVPPPMPMLVKPVQKQLVSIRLPDIVQSYECFLEGGFDVDIGYGVNADYTETNNINGLVVAVSDEDSEEKEITEDITPLNPLGDSGSSTIFSISTIVTFLAFSLTLL